MNENIVADFIKSVYLQDLKKAGALLDELLHGMAVSNWVFGPDEKTGERDIYLPKYTLLASAITTFFSNPQLMLVPQALQRVVNYKREMMMIFHLSGFRGTDHLLRLFADFSPGQSGQNKIKISSEANFLKFLLFVSLESKYEVDLTPFLKKNPKLVLPVILALLSEEVVMSDTASRMRDRLLTLGPLVEKVDISDEVLLRLSNAWMYCSYSTSNSKHDFKKSLNVLLQNFTNKHGIRNPDLPPFRKKKKPILLVVSEQFRSNHAMYRSYGPMLKQLTDKFSLILYSGKGNIDDKSAELFEDIIYPGSNETLKKVVGKIVKLKPDIIYYPSLGMSAYGLQMANLRLAPIQFMTLGHPATSNSPFIDYCIVPEVLFSQEVDCFSEKVILWDSASAVQMIPFSSDFSSSPQVNIRKKPDVIRLAVPSFSLKCSNVFIDVCQRISRESGRLVEFWFFVNSHNWQHQLFKQNVLAWLPNAKVFPGHSYGDYIAKVGQCDIHLSPFPFGGSNSDIDSMRQCIPLVAMEGDEPHSRTDSVFIGLSNLPKWLLTHSPEEYVQAALRIIHNDEERVAISEALSEQNFDEIFMDHEFKSHPKDFLETVDWLYQHHEEIQQDGGKVWGKERQASLRK